MGRNRSGVTTKEALRIELTKLLKSGFIKKGTISNSTFEWTNGSRISIQCHYTDEKQYIRLNYVFTSWQGEETDYDYKIKLTFVPSNLGKGMVPYFVCPITGKRCRILYKAYSSPIWKSKDAYNRTIFYASQTSSKLSIMNDKYWKLDKEIKAIYKDTRYQTHYKGKPTRRYERLQRLREKQNRADYLRFTPAHIPKVLRDFMF